jgi:hypothetical protein
MPKKTSATPNLDDFPLLKDALMAPGRITAKQLEKASTKSDIALLETPSRNKADYALASLLTIARKQTADGSSLWDTSRLLGSTCKYNSAVKKALNQTDVLNEFADFVFTVQSGNVEKPFAITAEFCPILCRIIGANMTAKQIKAGANKGDVTPGSSTKADFVPALLRTAAGRAAGHLLFVGRKKYANKAELNSLLNAASKAALGALEGVEALHATFEWCNAVELKYKRRIDGKNLGGAGGAFAGAASTPSKAKQTPTAAGQYPTTTSKPVAPTEKSCCEECAVM